MDEKTTVYGCWPGQTPLNFVFCRNPNGTTEGLHACFEGETWEAGICKPPAVKCTVGQVQVGVTCIDFPSHVIAVPINSCGFEISVVASVLLLNVLQCRS